MDTNKQDELVQYQVVEMVYVQDRQSLIRRRRDLWDVLCELDFYHYPSAYNNAYLLIEETENGQIGRLYKDTPDSRNWLLRRLAVEITNTSKKVKQEEKS